jgi:hypothetical protein
MNMKKEIISQYRAALKMLIDTIKKCQESAWEDETYENAYWRLVYHALYYTDLYLAQNPDRFTPWKKHRENYNYLGRVTRDNQPLIIIDTYSESEMLEYVESIFTSLEKSVNETKMDEQSGFPWLRMNKLEVHLYNLRHLQHHVGQLIERLHQAGIGGIKWESLG